MKRFVCIVLALAAIFSGPVTAATCSVSEFSSVITTFSGENIQIAKPVSPSPITQTVTATTPTALSNAFASGARFIWIYCDEVMHIQFGETPTTGLTTGDMRIPAGGFWIGLPNEVGLGTLKLALCDADCL